MEVCSFFRGLSANRPAGGGAAGERRQTGGVGPDGSGSTLLVSHFLPMSLSCSHLQLPSLSLKLASGSNGAGRLSEVRHTLNWGHWAYSCFPAPEASEL